MELVPCRSFSIQFSSLLHPPTVRLALLNQFLDGRENPLKARRAFEPRWICPLHIESLLYIRDGTSPTTLRALTLPFHGGILNLLDNTVESDLLDLRFSKSFRWPHG